MSRNATATTREREMRIDPRGSPVKRSVLAETIVPVTS